MTPLTSHYAVVFAVMGLVTDLIDCRHVKKKKSGMCFGFNLPMFLVLVLELPSLQLWNTSLQISDLIYRSLQFCCSNPTSLSVWSYLIRFYGGRAVHESLAFALFQWRPCWLSKGDVSISLAAMQLVQPGQTVCMRVCACVCVC